jgi:hypothetical protein
MNDRERNSVDDPVSVIAHAAADRLAPGHGPELAAELEAALNAQKSATPPQQYGVDPVSLGTLIVTIADLAWTIYTDLKKETPNPAPEVVARKVRVELRNSSDTSPTRSREITDVIVTEITKMSSDSE